MQKYIGITIGPIFDTISDATSPAALWFASYMFSDIAERLCKKITECFSDAVIYSPYYEKEVKEQKRDGVGKYHDRIFFSTSQYDTGLLDALIDAVKRETALAIEKQPSEDTKIFLSEYLQIHYVVQSMEQIEGENCILALSPYLDALELMKRFPGNDTKNPIRRLFVGKGKGKNTAVKESPLAGLVKDASQLKKTDGTIREISEIASAGETPECTLKRKKYFAIVCADGDSVGSFLKGLSEKEVNVFSKLCLQHAQEAANVIETYGGMTIYAGGDDLLFFAPLVTEKGDIIRLCNELRNSFVEKMDAIRNQFGIKAQSPTLSFGVSIQYEKYPLYEALKTARELLALAKQDGDSSKTIETVKKDNILIKLQKHSGQSLALLVPNGRVQSIEKVLTERNVNEERDAVNSVTYTLENMHSLIYVLNRQAVKEGKQFASAFGKAWKNFFDNPDQKKYEGYISELGRFYFDEVLMQETAPVSVPKEFNSETNTLRKDVALQTLIYLLRYKKFLTEEGE